MDGCAGDSAGGMRTSEVHRFAVEAMKEYVGGRNVFFSVAGGDGQSRAGFYEAVPLNAKGCCRGRRCGNCQRICIVSGCFAKIRILEGAGNCRTVLRELVAATLRSLGAAWADEQVEKKQRVIVPANVIFNRAEK